MGNSKKVKIIIYIEIDMYILSLILIPLIIKYAPVLEQVVLDQFKPEEKHNVRELMKTLYIVFLVCFGITRLISFILLIVLYKGYQQKSEGKLKFWFVVGCIVVVLIILSIMSTLAKNPKAFALIIPLIMSLIYRIWTLVVVKGFINEIQAGPQHPPFRGV